MNLKSQKLLINETGGSMIAGTKNYKIQA